MAATQLELGNHLYLFCQAGTNARRLIISAHGGTSGFFDTPKELYFYSALGNAMVDHTIAAIMNGYDEPAEVIGAGTVGTEDYELSKYQTHQGDGPETYDSLFEAVSNLATGPEEGLFDVVTIRNRLGVHNRTITLSYVLDKLRREQPGRFADYQEVHCSFCRV